MELIIKGKNISVPENARDYISKKIKKFDRHMGDISEAVVEISEEKTRSKDNRFIVEVTVQIKGTVIRAEERRADILAAFDAVSDVMVRQMKRYTDRAEKKRKQASRAVKGEIVGSGVPESDDLQQQGKVIRVKSFSMVPMPPDEATEQMELLGHNFFVFFNSETEKIAVVYRRNDGDYGMIEPELE